MRVAYGARPLAQRRFASLSKLRRVAEAWGYVTRHQTAPSLHLADRELAILYKLTH